MTETTTQSIKICRTCQQCKNISLFRPSRPDCKECDKIKAKEYQRKRRADNPEHYRAYQRKRYLEERGGKLGRVVNAVTRTEFGKTCYTCKEMKAWSEYTKDKYIKDGYSGTRRECTKIRKKKYLSSEKGRITNNNYKIIHKDVSRRAGRKYLQAHKEELAEYKKKYTLEDRRRWRENSERRKTEPGCYVIYQDMKAEVMSNTDGVIRIRILRTGKHVLTYKTHLKIWKNPLSY